jgi:hypothetical protein
MFCTHVREGMRFGLPLGFENFSISA